MAEETKHGTNTGTNTGTSTGEQQSSQDPAEGRRDIPKGNPTQQGNQTEPKHSFDDKSENKGSVSNEEPAEGRRDVG